jgi:hypothetical protein
MCFVPAAAAKHYPSPCSVQHPSDSTVEWECGTLTAGKTMEEMFGEWWIDVLRFNRIDRRHANHIVSLKIPVLLEDISQFTPMLPEYSPAQAEIKFILIDLSEQFLGAYEFGRLVFSAPITSGEPGNETPAGDFEITAAHRVHGSTLYTLEGTDIPYPMTYALKFHTTREGIGFWMHGRDVPGVPASHGCIGLYDEEMQKQYYGYPRHPILLDAKTLYEWVLWPLSDNDGRAMILSERTRVRIIGEAPQNLAWHSSTKRSAHNTVGCGP